VGSVGNPRLHQLTASRHAPPRGLSKHLWATRSVVQGDGGQVVGSARDHAARLAPTATGAVHELSTGAVRCATAHSPVQP
jgi:hypothetical protein